MTPEQAGSHPGSAGPVAESRYWQRTRVATGWLLMAWLGITLFATLAPGPWQPTWFGWPLHFWFGAQGALLLFLAIVFVYARRMDQLDQAAQGADPSEPQPEGKGDSSLSS